MTKHKLFHVNTVCALKDYANNAFNVYISWGSFGGPKYHSGICRAPTGA